MKDLDNIYVKLLKQARQDLESNKPISFNDFRDKVPNLTQQNRAFDEIYGHPSDGYTSNKVHFMTLEAYMKLLDHEELTHALEESRQARREAKWAMLAAVIAIVVQIVLWVADKIWTK
jgi:hypothetical protein